MILFRSSAGIEGECDMFDYLEDPTLIPIEVELRQQGEGREAVCGQASCTWFELEQDVRH